MASSPVMPMPRNLRTRTVTAPHMSTVPKRTRRTAAQIEADKQKKADEEASKAKQKAKALEDLAHHEHRKEQEVEQRLVEANRPPSEMRVKTPRPQKPILVISENIDEEDDDNYEADKTMRADSPDAMLLDDSDDEDPPPPKVRKPTPKAQGPTIRDQVDVLKASLAREEGGYKKKRKGNPIALTLSKKPRQSVKTGLRDIPVDVWNLFEDLEVPRG
ncbi:hypothetical protein FPV67DRAFT_1671138 [Lyophyllum atratum]|nr:hypothetical protein FPV67DRAFT_1671138 [Lyophyllum atratum]